MQLKSKHNISKVLHIVPSYFPAIKVGGPIESVRNLNLSLSKLGIQVDVFTTTSGIEKDLRPKVNAWIEDDGVQVKYFPSYFYDNYTFAPQLLYNALSDITGYDLVHITAFWNFPVLAGSFASILRNVPYIISPRGVLYEDAINIKSSRVKRLYYQLVSRHYLNKTQAIHFTTDDEKNQVAQFIRLPKKQFVVPNGIDTKCYEDLPLKGKFRGKHSISKDTNLILYLGRVHKQKGLDLLVDAFRDLCADDDNLCLAIVGPDSSDYSDVLRLALKKAGLMNKVIFVGLLSGKDKLEALVDANVFVLPSYFENFGMSVIEAMACGTPVVVSNRVGISADIRNNNAGVIVELTSDSLSQGIKNVIQDNDIKNKLVNSGKKLVADRYNVSVVGKKMLDAYQEVLHLQ